MALVSPSVTVHVQQPPTERLPSTRGLSSSRSVRSTGSVGSLRGIEEEPMEIEEEGEKKVYVAVVKDCKEGKSLLTWVFQNISREKKLVIVHVHRPAQMIPMMGGKFPASQLTDQQVQAYRKHEREKIDKNLDENLSLCSKFQAEKLVIEKDDVAKGLVELIAQNGITELVMGAAADKHFSKKMKTPRSKTALSVQQQADPSCKISFICKGNLICTREAGLDGSRTEYSSQSEQLRSRSLPERRTASFYSPMQDLFRRRSRCENFDSPEGGVLTAVASERPITTSNPCCELSTEEATINPCKRISRSTSQVASPSSCSFSGEHVSNLGPFSMATDEQSDVGSVVLPARASEEHIQFSTPGDQLEEIDADDEVYEKMQRAIEDTEKWSREAYEESCRRGKAERDAAMAQKKAKESKNLHAKEVKQRKEIEKTLARDKMELEKLRKQKEQVFEELQKAQEQKLALELGIAESNRVVKDFDERLIAAQCLVSSLKKEQEELRQERDEAVREAEELRQRNEEVTASNHGPSSFSRFSLSELKLATRNFDDSLKIGEGGYGSVYKGFLRHTTVAIKLLNPQGMQGLSEFHTEVDVLSRVRHPNLVTLIGTCPEAGALVYEFLPSGSLEDRLNQKNNTPPLSWRARTRIAAEICAALIFLHSSKPHSVVHGDLKPANILLDANFVSKLSDFGICRLLLQANTNTTIFRHTHPKGTFVYMDPEFLATGQLTPRSDVYSFGVIILRLLTRRPALGLVKEVQDALEKGCLHEILDPSAGQWPFVQAKKLAHLALRCCEIQRKGRPDLATEALWMLEPLLKAGSSTRIAALMSFGLAPENHSSAPSYFKCPISQEIMRDPQVAADGFTYDGEAIKRWMESGHDTSPVTNLKLTHSELIPNHALRSAIQEWLQQQ